MANWNNESYKVEKIQLDNGTYLSSNDINGIIQEISSYAANHGISFSSVENVKANSGAMQIIASHWHM